MVFLTYILTSGRPERVPSDFFEAGEAPTLDPTPADLETECSGVNAAALLPNTSAAAAGMAAHGTKRGAKT